ncbi:amino acid/polyamine transporter I [Diplogelasinospora grovesii]|uniref:Amino acid/polyamine transporter I n=1 Tax=Diplogelasinospora grovesii TaxID=303347 RepID=A0AAN6MZ46_9PEZI|nr:amino acid/polyamine transporter I [Diplogelasinospora grovesii]
MGQSQQRHNVGEDAAALERLGVKQELGRNFSKVSMLGLAFAILNSWTALAASLSLALPSGGPSAVIWGLMVAGICNMCLAASLAEFLSAYPTAGGQYHWASIISWKRFSPAISFATGWISVAAWVCLTATGGLLGSQLILGAISLMSMAYEPQSWHQFLIYIAYTLAALLINVFGTRLLPYFTKAAFFWSLAGFAIISITVLACAAPSYQEGAFVYGSFTNTTGWPDGLSWLLGLLQGAFALTGFDATIHMIEEIPRPQIQGPQIMLWCIGIGMFTGFVFLSCLLFVLKEVDAVINSTAGPLLQILYDATQNRAGAMCLLIFPLVCMLFTTTSIMATSSRMSYAFARDRGLPFSRLLAKVHSGLGVPVNALLWTTAWVIIFGCVFLGSSSAFNAIVSASVVALGVTYAIPPTINCLRGRTQLPETRAFKLSSGLGWTVNLVGIAWTALTTVLFVFPPQIPTTGTNMNYCVVAFGIILLIAVIQWLADGRKNYTGPHVDVNALMQGQVEGISAEEDASQSVAESSKPDVMLSY